MYASCLSRCIFSTLGQVRCLPKNYRRRKLSKSKDQKYKSPFKHNPHSCRRVIVDCDVGTDDAVALFLLLSAELKKMIKIEMIVCSRGNSSLLNVTRNTVRLLEAANRTDIPVYMGSHDTLLANCNPDEFYHGVDGFGDLKHDHEPDLSIVKPQSALQATSELILKNPNEITLINLGPLTNTGLLLRYYKETRTNIKELFIMGGNHKGVGNVTSAGEFNFWMDPEAAHNVFVCAGCPITLATWEGCLNSKIPLKWRNAHLTKKGGPTWKLIDRAEQAIYKNPKSDWLPCDAFMVASILYPDLIKNSIQRHLDIELNGYLTRGQTVLDHSNKKTVNANIIRKIDPEQFKELIYETITTFIFDYIPSSNGN